jgi:hypothetical protein
MKPGKLATTSKVRLKHTGSHHTSIFTCVLVGMSLQFGLTYQASSFFVQISTIFLVE